MPRQVIDLSFMETEVMLVVEHSTGVIYINQVGGVGCARPEIEGALAPVDLREADVQRIMGLPYVPGRGLQADNADAIDAILISNVGGRHLRVDRERLHESYEAWVFVVGQVDDFSSDWFQRDYAGSVFGFGTVKGVLTWPNSD